MVSCRRTSQKGIVQYYFSIALFCIASAALPVEARLVSLFSIKSATTSNTMKKDSKHRKRHTPPGPCGVWYQTQQQLRSKKSLRTTDSSTATAISLLPDTSNDEHRNQGYPIHDNDDHAKKQHPVREAAGGDEPRTNEPSMEEVRFSPAWKSMMMLLNLKSPTEMQAGMTAHQRYAILRPCLPPPYVLLYEILRGDHDLCVQDPNTRLLVLVHSVESHIHHNIWTVELQDESGATIRAWIEPKFVQEQMKDPAGLSMIRPGVAWMLRKVSIIVVSNDQEEKVERMLLISGKHVEQSWAPEHSKEQQQQQPYTMATQASPTEASHPKVVEQSWTPEQTQQLQPQQIVHPVQANPTESQPVANSVVDGTLNASLEITVNSGDCPSDQTKERAGLSQSGSALRSEITTIDTRTLNDPEVEEGVCHSENNSAPRGDKVSQSVASKKSNIEPLSQQVEKTGADAWRWLNEQSTPHGPPLVSTTPKTIENKSLRTVSGDRTKTNGSCDTPLREKSSLAADITWTNTSSPAMGTSLQNPNNALTIPTIAKASESPEQRRHKTSASLTCSTPQQPSNLWDVQDSSILDMLDDTDDLDSIIPASQKAMNEKKRVSLGKDAVPETSSTSPRSPSSTQKSEASYCEQPSSLFEASNFESIDMSAFSDDD